MTKTTATIVGLLFAAGYVYAERPSSISSASSPSSPTVSPSTVQADAELSPIEDEPPTEIAWMTEAEAKASGRYIFYHVSRSRGCPPCIIAENRLDNPLMAQGLEGYACVRVIDAPASHPWMKHFRITAVPTDIFSDPKTGRFIPFYGGVPKSVAEYLFRIKQATDALDGKVPAKPVAESRVEIL